MIGGGGAGQFTYDNFEYDAGSAGDITYVSGLDTNGPIAVTIGQGGVSSAAAESDSSGNGSATTLDDGSSSSSAAGGVYRLITMQGVVGV